MASPSDPGWWPNPGYRPDRAVGRRVRVKLRGHPGEEAHEPHYAADLDPMCKPGWPADKSRWSFKAEDDPSRAFDIVEYSVL